MKKIKQSSLVVKSNQIIEASYKLSIQEQRIILYMVSMIQPDDEDFKPVRIDIKKLVKIIGLESINHTHMQQTTKDLLEKVLTIRQAHSTLQIGWLSSAEYFHGEGFMELEFSPKLKPYLLQLKERFTKYVFNYVIRLKHTYSIRFYELLKQYENIGGQRYFDLENLREILGISGNEYKLYGDFKKKVIVPAKKEFDLKYNKHEIDFTFEYEEKKEGRKVIGIKFEILKPSIQLELFDKNKVYENSVIDLDHSELIAELITFKLTKKQINNLLKKYSVERIKSNIEVTNKKIKFKEVNNPPAFLLDAIEGDYASNQIDCNSEFASFISEANKCWANNKGGCAAIWNNYKDLKNHACYFCKKFEKQRDVSLQKLKI